MFRLTLLLLCIATHCYAQLPYPKGALLFADDFRGGMQHWVVETPPSQHARVYTDKGKLVMDVDSGATVWLNKKLSGNYLITYRRTVLVDSGGNDRLSDLNQFWMATDPRNTNLFTRYGTFSQYDSLQLYYFGMGGNSNTTTRFRRYDGKGARVLLADHADSAHLLRPNHTYTVQTVVHEGRTEVYVDGRLYAAYTDPQPLRSGYFGLRTTWSRQAVSDVRIYRLGSSRTAGVPR